MPSALMFGASGAMVAQEPGNLVLLTGHKLGSAAGSHTYLFLAV